MSIQYLTPEKLEELKKEQEDIKKVQMPAIAVRIDEARQMGDLSENAEYHAARDEMSWAKSRIMEIAYIIDNSEVIDSSKVDKETVEIGNKIIVEVQGKEKEFTIVGAQEADPLNGLISNESPLGSAFLGKKKGAVVEVEVPAGLLEYTIIDIQ
ncbi:transcription elongation factor GreA [Patescibacteria group bacterium]|nr:transcription elongation factor GreA [Patescibacteria group bacterium]MBU1721976.1 transcription elongation factor GreA [Patescibacteria group bacterium]MBU1901275.1 transcription elongation factor GreA [Patescibacteria group bacterium]